MSEVLKGCKTFEVGSGVSSPLILHPPWCFIRAVGWICHSLDETERGNDLGKPKQGCTKITFLAVVVLEAQPLPGGSTLWGSTLPFTCPLLRLFLKQLLLLFLEIQLWNGRTHVLTIHGLSSWTEWRLFSRAVQCLRDRELSGWLWASFTPSPDPEVCPGNSPLRYP